ncbi:tetratricopeptide repeat protein [Pseudoalteromonas sp. G4]|uniref:tetratricopeptide repeat protein n=1 Tax=Pseudoalteromonas sp. G4 TaxID=2992761 RepID=UPI00237EACEB|nr:tetratricopeptide repeat protein [Pseudoalteromonas sp. G4]MDE3271101.1 tetratricopeptide repeat protein [Pseudoalteromonas sp. G4]
MRLSFCLVLLLLMGCNSTQNTHKPPPLLLNDDQFSLVTIESKQDVFELSESTIAIMEAEISRSLDKRLTTRSLLKYIFSPENQSLNYLTGATLTAEETFNSKDANCLSLSIMAHSMAKHFGIESRFQQVFIPEYWASENGYSLLTGHVNLRLKRPSSSDIALTSTVYDAVGDLIVDFNPSSFRQKFRTKIISEDLILAMFYNNKGAAAMINGEHDLAYSYFSAAIESAPEYSSSFGNLGVLYRISNHFKQAEIAYNHALLLDSGNNTAKGNLARLYDLTNRSYEAERIREALEHERSKNPYYAIAKGNEALYQQDFEQAIRFFKKSIKLDRKIHESHFGLAKAYFYIGELDKALSELEKAEKHAYFDGEKRRYRGKIMSLTAHLIQ